MVVTRTRVVLDGLAIDRLLHSPEGDVAKLLYGIRSDIGPMAASMVRPSRIRSNNRGLRYSIVGRLSREGSTLVMTIGSPLKYAEYYHTPGTKAHVILPKKKKALRFYSQKTGAFVIVKKVNHPGFAGVPFLTRPMEIVIGRLLGH